MPVYADRREKVFQTVSDFEGKPVTALVGTSVLEQHSTNVPFKVRRAKPSDLFRDGTPLSFSENRTKYDSGSWTEPGSRFTGPCSFIAAAGPVFGLHQAGGLADFQPLDARLREKIKNSSMNAAVALAERSQTLSLVTAACKDILRTYRSFRNGTVFAKLFNGTFRPRTPHDVALANKWLEYSFGWRPLMSDIYGAAEEIHKSVHEGFPYYVRTSGGGRRVSSVMSNHASGPVSRSFVESCELRAKARFTVRNSSVKSLVQLGLTNPAEIAWEVVPFSFVIDWFIPVGDFIASLDSLVGVQDLTVCRGYKYESVWTTSTAGGKGVQRSIAKVRLGNTSDLALPALQPRLPNNPFQKLSLAVALLTQIRGAAKPLPTRR